MLRQILLAAIFTALGITGALANTIYTYTGDPFSSFDQTTSLPLKNPFTSSMSVTGQLVLSDPIAPNSSIVLMTYLRDPVVGVLQSSYIAPELLSFTLDDCVFRLRCGSARA